MVRLEFYGLARFRAGRAELMVDAPTVAAALAAADAACPVLRLRGDSGLSSEYRLSVGGRYFTENLDQDFANQNRVFKLGSGESMTPAPGYKLETFEDPFGGGYIYAAPSKDDGSAPVAAPRQILMAKDYKAKWDAAVSAGNAFEAAKWEAKTRDAVRNLEMMRGLSSIFGQ